ncbi:helix-hairpin-helix domain-containing protein [bacterium]|nr:helix-hairpin-helix domain-containing protein [bacterium]
MTDRKRAAVYLEKLNPCYDETGNLLNFTRQERVVIYFLVITLGVGAILKMVRYRRLEKQLEPTRFYAEEQRFNEISKQINSGSIVLIDSTDIGATLTQGTDNVVADVLLPGSTAININIADLDELCTLPGIGPAIAKRIRAYIDENGPFKNKADILQVKGIGEILYSRIEGLITIDLSRRTRD